jgi:hypothetical protein
MQPRAFRRLAYPSQTLDRETAFDPDSSDFVTFLSRRMGVDRELTTEVLGHWLTHYESVEPSATAKETSSIDANRSARREPAVASGVYPAIGTAGLRATGTDS